MAPDSKGTSNPGAGIPAPATSAAPPRCRGLQPPSPASSPQAPPPAPRLRTAPAPPRPAPPQPRRPLERSWGEDGGPRGSSRQRGGDVREPGERRGGSGGASRVAGRPGLRPPRGSLEAGARRAREQWRRPRRVLLPRSLSPGGWRASAARGWEFSLPGSGGCSITRVSLGRAGWSPAARLCLPPAVHPLLRFDLERQRCPAPRRGPKHTTRPASLPDACPQLGLGRTGRRWGSRVKAGGAGLGPGGATEPTGCRMRKTGTRAWTVRFASGGSLAGREGGGDPRRGTVLGGSPLPRLFLW